MLNIGMGCKYDYERYDQKENTHAGTAGEIVIDLRIKIHVFKGASSTL